VPISVQLCLTATIVALATGLAGSSTAISLGACGTPATPVHAIQGSGRSSPLRGDDLEVEAIVVGAFSAGLGGFFIQQDDDSTDEDPTTSEGLFVFGGGLGAKLEAGDRVRVRGRVSEFFGLTELFPVTDVIQCIRFGRASAVRVRLPVSDASDWERWEGMRVQLDQALVATGHRNLARFGEVELSAGGRLWQPTHRAAPGAAATALALDNARRRILLDDATDARDPVPTPYLERDDGGTLRLGDRTARVDGVVDFAFGRFRIHPIRPIIFEPGDNPRQPSPPVVDGTLRVAVWNLENHFNGDGRGGGFPTRGPRSLVELERQRDKLVSTLIRLDPDIAALVELENDGVGPDTALRQLADALNLETSNDPFAIVDTGGRLGTHAIAVGMLYRPSAVTPFGAPAVLDANAHPDFDDSRNRPSLAQTFVARATGERITVVANHLKSKGSNCDSGADPDADDGQGECNLTRMRAAGAIVDWLASDPTQSDGAPVLVTGDLNAYPQEDPLRKLASGGYLDLLALHSGPDAHTFVFSGGAGRLDYALGRFDLVPYVGGADTWNTNADEPRAFDYRIGNQSNHYHEDPFRASDHNPIIVGLFPDTDADGLTDSRDACPNSVLHATLMIDECDSRVPESLDEAGCNLTDELLMLRDDVPSHGSWMQAVRGWLGSKIRQRELSIRDRGHILACAAAATELPVPGDGRHYRCRSIQDLTERRRVKSHGLSTPHYPLLRTFSLARPAGACPTASSCGARPPVDRRGSARGSGADPRVGREPGAPADE
jgi:predicted extracellular nuclease